MCTKLPISLHKTVGPTVQLQYLGINLDTDRMEARLPDDKLSRIITILDMLKNKHSISKRELLSLLGHLNFASRVIPQVHSFVAYLLSLAASVKQLHQYVKLNKECLLDITIWHRFLTEWNQELTKAVDWLVMVVSLGTGGFRADGLQS